MVSDPTPGAAIATASSNPRDFAKKKRVNRSAKLRQCKLDARREQWLSQVKTKGEFKDEVNGVGDTHGGPASFATERGVPIGKLDMKPRVKEEACGGGLSRHHYSDSESSPSNSPGNPINSLLSSSDSVINFMASCGTNSGRSSSSSNDFFPCITSEDDEGNAGDDGSLDDWEVIADALSAPEDKQQEHSSELGLQPSEDNRNSAQHSPRLSMANQPTSQNVTSNAKANGGADIMKSPVHTQAWRADDAFRPRSLPNLSRQHIDHGESTRGCTTDQAVPPACPICYEDFDCTDSSFLPCSCGFRLCLFCHKTILDGDGRCPGCRKHYNSHPVQGEATLDGRRLTFRLTRSHSMHTKP